TRIARKIVYRVQSATPVKAILRQRSALSLVSKTAPIATIGDNGSSQKHATVRTASAFAVLPGPAAAITWFMLRVPPTNDRFRMPASTTVVNGLVAARVNGRSIWASGYHVSAGRARSASRSSRRLILPLGVLGRADTNSIRRGYL